jgi:hypothetical protein
MLIDSGYMLVVTRFRGRLVDGETKRVEEVGNERLVGGKTWHRLTRLGSSLQPLQHLRTLGFRCHVLAFVSWASWPSGLAWSQT